MIGDPKDQAAKFCRAPCLETAQLRCFASHHIFRSRTAPEHIAVTIFGLLLPKAKERYRILFET